MADSQVKLSIVILSWNTKELLMQCIKSLTQISNLKTQNQNLKLKSEFEIIIVDNGSSDGSVELVKSSKACPEPVEGLKVQSCSLKLKVIENKENLGFARGNNIGIKEARGEYIMLLNSDTIIEAGVIPKMLTFLNDREEMSIVGPNLLNVDGTQQIDYYMRFPNLWQVFLYHNPILRPIIMRIPFLSSLIAQKSGLFPFEVDQLPGAALIAHREIWKKVGLLDEEYHFLFEDVDWCWRARKLGIKLKVVPDAKITHIGGASWKNKLKYDKQGFYYQFFSSMLLFVRKNYSGFSAAIFKWAIVLNFLFSLKFKLACEFYKNNGRQKEFLR